MRWVSGECSTPTTLTGHTDLSPCFWELKILIMTLLAIHNAFQDVFMWSLGQVNPSWPPLVMLPLPLYTSLPFPTDCLHLISPLYHNSLDPPPSFLNPNCPTNDLHSYPATFPPFSLFWLFLAVPILPTSIPTHLPLKLFSHATTLYYPTQPLLIFAFLLPFLLFKLPFMDAFLRKFSSFLCIYVHIHYY